MAPWKIDFSGTEKISFSWCPEKKTIFLIPKKLFFMSPWKIEFSETEKVPFYGALKSDFKVTEKISFMAPWKSDFSEF